MIQKLGKYTIVEKLGEGAMGAVYKAYDEILGRHVAVKTMAEDIKWDQELKLRFYREARSAASLQHPNIVIIHDLGEEGKITYIVMELLEGKDLKGIIRDRDKLSLESRLAIMAQVCDGLSHAHQRGIIHRDIKPGNIHVTPAGNVKILDFGIARIPSSDLTRSGVRLGTPVYMSPEQIRGGHYDERSDMFSAGIVFYEFLTYSHPFRDKNIVKTMDNILFQTELPFAEQLPDAPPSLWTFLNTCLTKEPEQRYASIGEAARACRKILDEMNLAAQRYLSEIQGAVPALIHAAERAGSGSGLVPLSQSVREALHGDQRASYATLKSLRDALQREALLGASGGQPPAAGAMPGGVAGPSASAQGISTPAQGARPEEVVQGEAFLKAGQSKLGEDKPEEALTLFRQAIGVLGPREDVVQLLARARHSIEDKKRTRVSEMLNAARSCLADARFAEAGDRLDEALQLAPDNVEAAELRRQALSGLEAEKNRQARREQADADKAAGLRLLSERKFQDSLKLLQRAREVLGEQTAVRLGIAECNEGIRLEEIRKQTESEIAEALQLYKSENLEGARARIKRALELSPKNADALELLGNVERAAEQKDRATRVLKLTEDARNALGVKAFEQATVLATEALALDASPKSPTHGLLEEIAERKERARREEEAALLLRKADDALQRGEHEDAELYVGEVLKTVPDHALAHERLKAVQRSREELRRKKEVAAIIAQAQHSFLSGDLTQSEAHARRALAMDPECAKAKDVIGRVDAAREKLRTERITTLLGEAEKALSGGDTAAASLHAQEALKIDAANKAAPALLKRIADAEAERRRQEIAELLARGRTALGNGAFKEARDLAQQVFALEAGNKPAKALIKDTDKAAKTADKEREKQEKQLAQRLKEQTVASGPSTAPSETTVILKRRKSPVPKLALWGGVAIIVLGLAAATAYWLSSRRQTTPAVDLTAQIAAAREAIDRRLYEDAIGQLEKVLQTAPQNEEARALLAEAQRQKRVKDIEQLLIEAQSQRARQELQESYNTVQRVLAIDPSYEPAVSLAAQLEVEIAEHKSREEVDADVKQWLASARGLITTGKMPEAKALLDRIGRLRPDEPELAPLRKLLKGRIDQDEARKKQAEADSVSTRQARYAEFARRVDDFLKQGKYAEAQAQLDQWLSEESGNSRAQRLKARAEEALSARKAYDAAMAGKDYDGALAAAVRLQGANPADPGLAEMNRRAQAGKAQAKATITLLRLGDPGTVTLDGQSVGANGEIETKTVPIGRHKIVVAVPRGALSWDRIFYDGDGIELVYDSASGEIRQIADGDRELRAKRIEREQVSRYSVEHEHGFWRSCKGELRISGFTVEYRGSEKEHSFSAPLAGLTLSLKDEKITLSGLKNGKPEFKLQNAQTAKELKERWDRLQKLAK